MKIEMTPGLEGIWRETIINGASGLVKHSGRAGRKDGRK